MKNLKLNQLNKQKEMNAIKGGEKPPPLEPQDPCAGYCKSTSPTVQDGVTANLRDIT